MLFCFPFSSQPCLLFLTSGLAGSQFLFVLGGKKNRFSFPALAQLVCCLPVFRNELLHYYFMGVGLATIVTTTVAYIEFLYFTDKNSVASCTDEVSTHSSQYLFTELYFSSLGRKPILITIHFYISYMTVTLLDETLTHFFKPFPQILCHISHLTLSKRA